MKKRKILVTFYSRDGHCREVAGEISRILKADKEDIIDKTSRKGIVGWLVGGKDAFTKKLTEISFKEKPEKYDLVIIGTPVWASTMTPAIRKYLIENKNKLKKVAFFCCFGRSASHTFLDMEKLSKKPIAVLGLGDKEEREEKIKEFCGKLR